MDNRKYDCVFCIHNDECDLESRKDHAYNLRDGTADCFTPHGYPVPPWSDPFSECYGCMNHTYEDCCKCNDEEVVMDKAILVIDLPVCCNECSLMVKDEYSYFCPIKCDENKTDLYDNYIMFHRKPNWCPLNPVPQKLGLREEYPDDFSCGWNACINKITSTRK